MNLEERVQLVLAAAKARGVKVLLPMESLEMDEVPNLNDCRELILDLLNKQGTFRTVRGLLGNDVAQLGGVAEEDNELDDISDKLLDIVNDTAGRFPVFEAPADFAGHTFPVLIFEE